MKKSLNKEYFTTQNIWAYYILLIFASINLGCFLVTEKRGDKPAYTNAAYLSYQKEYDFSGRMKKRMYE